MAEFVMKDLVKQAGLEQEIYVASAATSREELGNPVHYGTREKLAQYGISVAGKYATQMTKEDYKKYDYIFVMDQNNMRNAMRIIGTDHLEKIQRLLDLTSNPRDIADPWYTGNFHLTYEDVREGCEKLLEVIRMERGI